MLCVSDRNKSRATMRFVIVEEKSGVATYCDGGWQGFGLGNKEFCF